MDILNKIKQPTVQTIIVNVEEYLHCMCKFKICSCLLVNLVVISGSKDSSFGARCSAMRCEQFLYINLMCTKLQNPS